MSITQLDRWGKEDFQSVEEQFATCMNGTINVKLGLALKVKQMMVATSLYIIELDSFVLHKFFVHQLAFFCVQKVQK